MIIQVFQIWYGETIPDDIMGYLNNVSAWAVSQGYEYVLFRELPQWAIPLQSNIDLRIVSDIERIKKLYERPYRFYLDCDCESTGPVSLAEDVCLFPYLDNAIYNGANTEFFKLLHFEINRRIKQSRNEWMHEEGMIYKAFRRVPFNPDWVRNENTGIIHHAYTQTSRG